MTKSSLGTFDCCQQYYFQNNETQGEEKATTSVGTTSTT